VALYSKEDHGGLTEEQWNRLRERVKDRQGHRCYLCNRPEGDRVWVRHKTREAIGKHPGFTEKDLVALCRRCRLSPKERVQHQQRTAGLVSWVFRKPVYEEDVPIEDSHPWRYANQAKRNK